MKYFPLHVFIKQFIFILLTAAVHYAQVPISDLKQNNANGIPTGLGQTFTVSGVVTCSNQFGNSGPGALQDHSAGISVYGSNFANAVNIGDSVTVTAKLDQYNGLTQLNFNLGGASVTVHQQVTQPEPAVVTIQEIKNQQWNGFEEFEGKLIRINNVHITGSGNFSGGSSGQNYPISDTTGTLEIRIDESVNIVGTPIPSGNVDIIGILGQFKYSAPYNGGYQLLPRFILDIVDDGRPVILNPVFAADIDTSSFTVYFNTARNGNSQVKYGLTPSLELDSIVINDDTTFHVVPVTGLQPATLYYFKAYSTNAQGTSQSSFQQVTTASNDTSTGEINVYFNFPVDTSVAIQGNIVTGNADLEAKLIERINHADYSIDLALYSFFGMPNVANAIIVAKNRGVKIRIVYDSRDGGAVQNSMQQLLNAGILMSRRPTGIDGIMHNKFFIFDSRDSIASNDWVWTGSWNVTSLEVGWKNNIIEINDPAVANAYQTEFEEMWGSSNDIPDPSNAKFGSIKSDNTQHTFIVGGRELKVYFSPSDQTESKIIQELNLADNSVYMALYAVTINSAVNALYSRYSAGVTDIRGLVDQINITGSVYNSLDNFAEMYHNVAPTMHHKYSIIDASYPGADPIVITGSHNWSNNADDDNDENTVIIRDLRIANQYLQEFKKRYNEDGGTGSFVIPAAVDEYELNELSMVLYQNYPNPFNPVTTIRFEVPFSQEIEITLFDILGREVKSIFKGTASAGLTTIDLNASDLSSGIYLYTLKTKQKFITKKLLLLK